MNWNEYDIAMEATHAKQAARVQRSQVDRVNNLINDLVHAASQEAVMDILADHEEQILEACEEVNRIKRRNPLGFC